MRVSRYLDALADRLDDGDRPGDGLASVTAPDGTTTVVPVTDVRETRLETKYRTDAWITTDEVYRLDERR